MSTAASVTVAVVFVWLGMVLAISFVETPLKFRAPGVTIPIGLGIGRLVFRALNSLEGGFAVVVVAAWLVDPPAGRVGAPLAIVIAVLVVQVGVVRPRLGRRTTAVLAGADAPRSRVHYWYVGLEAVKVVALVVGGVLLLT